MQLDEISHRLQSVSFFLKMNVALHDWGGGTIGVWKGATGNVMYYLEKK